MSIKMAKADAEALLPRLDKMAGYIQANYKAWGCPEAAAKEMVATLDKMADQIEVGSFGGPSLQIRQTQLIAGKEAAEALKVEMAKTASTPKEAQVIQQDKDEKYMAAFGNPMAPVQTEGDEPYMKAYGDDQSSAVIHAKSTSGRPLAPGHLPP